MTGVCHVLRARGADEAVPAPKRSAFSTMITVAFGTLIPTSITVVDTRTWSFILCKCSHDLVFFCLFHPPMKRSDPGSCHPSHFAEAAHSQEHSLHPLLALFYHRTNHIALSSFGDLLLHEAVSSRSVTGIHHTVLDWQTVCRKFINHRNIQISI